MPPKFLFKREEVVSAAINVIRKNGAGGLTARSLAAELGCSVKPIFGLFKNMDELKLECIKAADKIYIDSINNAATTKDKPYKAMGMAYIRFAKEEKELFKLLFMRDRSSEKLNTAEDEKRAAEYVRIISAATGLNEQDAYLLHIESWIYVHGVATMIATNYLDWDSQFISDSLTDCYTGLLHRFKNRNSEQ